MVQASGPVLTGKAEIVKQMPIVTRLSDTLKALAGSAFVALIVACGGEPEP